jgi:hypothetical protein
MAMERLDKVKNQILFALAGVAFGYGACAQAPNTGLPHLEKRGQATQLIVDGKPFLVLGGETHNSSSSSPEYMKPVWKQLAGMHLNTAILPVAWETIEPAEGKPLSTSCWKTRAPTTCTSSSCGLARGRTPTPATRPDG